MNLPKWIVKSTTQPNVIELKCPNCKYCITMHKVTAHIIKCYICEQENVVPLEVFENEKNQVHKTVKSNNNPNGKML